MSYPTKQLSVVTDGFPPQSNTYTLHLHGGEQSAGHEHAQGDGHDEDEGECQGEGAHLDCPQDPQTDELDQREHVHAQGFYLQTKGKRRRDLELRTTDARKLTKCVFLNL